MDLSRDDFRALAAGHTVVPVWRELVSDLETPVAAYLKLAGDGPDATPSFLLESVEHGDTWGRFSFVGRQPSATIVARGGRLEVDGILPAGVPLDRGVLAAVEGLLHEYRSPVLPDLPPLHGGVVGYLGYDVVREVEHLPSPPPDDLGHPDAVLSVIGHVAAFDHWRQRVYLIENVRVTPHISLAELAIKAHFQKNFAHLGLTQKQIAVLWLVNSCPGIIQVDIARMLRVQRATVAGVVTILTARGLLRRTGPGAGCAARAARVDRRGPRRARCFEGRDRAARKLGEAAPDRRRPARDRHIDGQDLPQRRLSGASAHKLISHPGEGRDP